MSSASTSHTQRRFFQHETVDVPLQGGEVVQFEAGRRNGAANHFIGVIEEMPIVRRAASEVGDEAGPGFTTGAVGALRIICGAQRNVTHGDFGPSAPSPPPKGGSEHTPLLQ